MKNEYSKLPVQSLLNFCIITEEGDYLDPYSIIEGLKHKGLKDFYYNSETKTLHKTPSHPPATIRRGSIIHINPIMLPNPMVWLGTTRGYYNCIEKDYSQIKNKDGMD